jgi:hypothetical protein
MSYQRAVTNCRMCYHLALNYIGDNVRKNPEEMKKRMFNDMNIHNVRNEAMSALEQDLRVDVSPSHPNLGVSATLQALTACMNCHHELPAISAIYSEKEGEKK